MRCILSRVFHLKRGLQFQGKMKEFKDEVADQVKLVFVIGGKFPDHTLIDTAYFIGLRIIQFKNMASPGLKDLIMLELAKLVEEMGIENTIDPLADPVQVLPFIGDLWVGKAKCLFLHFHDPVCIMNLAVPFHQHDLVKIPSPVGNPGGLPLHIGFQSENIEMPDLLAEVFRDHVKLESVKFLQGF